MINLTKLLDMRKCSLFSQFVHEANYTWYLKETIVDLPGYQKYYLVCLLFVPDSQMASIVSKRFKRSKLS